MTEHDDQLIHSFFSRHPQEPLPDDGFTARVMEQISLQHDVQTAIRVRRWIAFCVAVGIVAFVVLGGKDILMDELTRLRGNLLGMIVNQMVSPQGMLNALLGMFSLLALVCMLIADSHRWEEKDYGM